MAATGVLDEYLVPTRADFVANKRQAKLQAVDCPLETFNYLFCKMGSFHSGRIGPVATALIDR